MTVSTEEVGLVAAVAGPLLTAIGFLWRRNVKLEAALLRLAQEGTAATVKLATILEERRSRRRSPGDS